MKYFVTVFTGREPGSESNAKIHLNIFGDLGDSGKRLLRISDKVKPFQRGQVSYTFHRNIVVEFIYWSIEMYKELVYKHFI